MTRPRDETLLVLAQVLEATNAALLATDANPLMATGAVHAELTDKFLYTVKAMTKLRAYSLSGKRAKAIALQWLAEKLLPPADPFTDLSLSLARDLARPFA